MPVGQWGWREWVGETEIFGPFIVGVGSISGRPEEEKGTWVCGCLGNEMSMMPKVNTVFAYEMLTCTTQERQPSGRSRLRHYI